MSFAGDGIWDMGDREVEAKDYGLQTRLGEPSFAPNLADSGGASEGAPTGRGR
jgi:hypothetical protein